MDSEAVVKRQVGKEITKEIIKDIIKDAADDKLTLLLFTYIFKHNSINMCLFY